MAERDMAGDYEVLQRFKYGGKTMLLGFNSGDNSYMTCYEQANFLGDMTYPDAIGSFDYAEVFAVFMQRMQRQMDEVQQFRENRGVPHQMLTHEYCRKRGEKESLDGKLVILRPTSLAAEYRTADCQLGYALGGFGCEANARGRAVYFEELFSGEHCRWNTEDVLGLADIEKLPDWAKQKVRERELNHAKQQKQRGEAR